MNRPILTDTFAPPDENDTDDEADEFFCDCDDCINDRLLDYLEDRAS